MLSTQMLKKDKVNQSTKADTVRRMVGKYIAASTASAGVASSNCLSAGALPKTKAKQGNKSNSYSYRKVYTP